MSREVKVDVDKNSGFCAGVIRAVNIAEENLFSRCACPQ